MPPPTTDISAATSRFLVPQRPDWDGAGAEDCALWLCAQNSGFILELLSEAVGHCVFLNEATDLGRREAPGICRDPPGVDRRSIHNRAAGFANTHFRNALEAAA